MPPASFSPSPSPPTTIQKYDRQLRIWGDHGQAQLASARVCLLNAGPTGSEALKNLVLGGIGSFTVVDGKKVEEADLGNNFLVEYEALGQSKAQVVSSLLQELNELAAARFVEEDPDALIDKNPGFFADFNLVIATQMRESSLVKLDRILRALATPCRLIAARSYGLMGVVHVSGPEHCVVESKPDNTVDDLRLHKPWPELKQFAEAFDLDTDDTALHSHIPFAIILLKTLDEWRSRNATAAAAASRAQHAQMSGEGAAATTAAEEEEGGGADVKRHKAMDEDTDRSGSARSPVPSTSKERSEYKAIISAHKRELDEENYKEALASAFKVWAPPSIDSALSAILNDKATQIQQTSTDFWIMVAALKGFLDNEGGGDLPLDGTIPDMHSFTEFYVQLQKVYQQKAEADIAAVVRRVQSLLRSIGRDTASISPARIKSFCRNARNLRVIRYKPLSEEYEGSAARSGLVRTLKAGGDSSTAGGLYLLLRAADRFFESARRFPGSFDGDVPDEDVARLRAVASAILAEASSGQGSEEAVGEDLLAEFCRFGASEIHCVAAVVGGIASQEAIKLITGQFTPLSGTFVYNAISSTSTILGL